MNQQQLEQWIAQNGGASAVQFQTKTVNVKNPAKSMTLDDGSDNPNYDPTAPATISMQVLSWTNPKTGATISVRPSGQDSYEVVEQAGAKPASATDPGAAAQDANQVELQRQRERNAALPADQDPAYETDAERRARGRQTVTDQGTAAEKAAAATRQAAADQRQAEQDKAAAEARNRPQVSYKKIGTKTYKVLTYPDGREEVSESALPPDITDDQITTVNGQPARVVRDPNGKATGLEVLPVSGQGSDPTFTGSPPPWVPQAVRDDLTGYSKQLQDAVASGAITPARATQLMQDRYRSAQAAIDNQLDAAKSVYTGETNQRTQDISLANARLTASQQGINRGLDFFKEVNPRLKEGSTAGADAFLAMRNLAYQDAQRYGGLNEIPRVPIPAALQSAANSITITQPDGTTVTVPHGGGAAGPSPAAPAAPAMAPVQPSPDLPNPNAANLLGSMRAPAPTGFAAVDQISNQIEQGPPLTFSSMEDTFRRAGMDEDAIAASRRNFLGAA